MMPKMRVDRAPCPRDADGKRRAAKSTRRVRTPTATALPDRCRVFGCARSDMVAVHTSCHITFLILRIWIPGSRAGGANESRRRALTARATVSVASNSNRIANSPPRSNPHRDAVTSVPHIAHNTIRVGFHDVSVAQGESSPGAENIMKRKPLLHRINFIYFSSLIGIEV